MRSRMNWGAAIMRAPPGKLFQSGQPLAQLVFLALRVAFQFLHVFRDGRARLARREESGRAARHLARRGGRELVELRLDLLRDGKLRLEEALLLLRRQLRGLVGVLMRPIHAAAKADGETQ